MYYEQRTYIAAPGKLDDLHRRFRDHTLRLFEKHKIQVVGFWTPDDPNNVDVTYLLSYPDREARDRSWDAFRADPEWIAAKSASEQNGVLVAKIITQFLKPTDYSPLK